MNARELLDQMYLEMRWRTLSLASDLDRIERAQDGAELLRSDARLQNLYKAVQILTDAKHNRAEQVQMLLSDTSPAPARQ
jgi:hypothetical protein